NNVSASAFLQMFRFQPPQQYDLISKLSGGEKQRLYLCTVLMQQPNFLILDEPTNDLDIITLQVLEDYLVNFKGCVLIVSHDRFFLDKIVDHVFVFSSNGAIKDFPGNYSQYRYSKEFAESPKPLKQPVSIPEKKQISAPAKSGLTYKERLEIQQIEMDLKSLETQKQELNNKISDSSVNQIELFASSKQLGEVIIRISELELRWLELSAKADM
ncbi:MAG TPA: ATP-binding cassette domain-containing protein, partial [Bacteroidales bacterium]|nr:ATP-binding cassette domain-containing protein [Bacteroidales bacterium]